MCSLHPAAYRLPSKRHQHRLLGKSRRAHRRGRKRQHRWLRDYPQRGKSITQFFRQASQDSFLCYRGLSESAADDADETESIGESSTGTRIRRTESERMQYFNDQLECGELEMHRAFCTRCNSWVNLGKRQSYTVRPWEKHRAKCDLKPLIVKGFVSSSSSKSMLC